jgi:hypothetical protein
VKKFSFDEREGSCEGKIGGKLLGKEKFKLKSLFAQPVLDISLVF